MECDEIHSFEVQFHPILNNVMKLILSLLSIARICMSLIVRLYKLFHL